MTCLCGESIGFMGKNQLNVMEINQKCILKPTYKSNSISNPSYNLTSPYNLKSSRRISSIILCLICCFLFPQPVAVIFLRFLFFVVDKKKMIYNYVYSVSSLN